jgi:hypothetical protein
MFILMKSKIFILQRCLFMSAKLKEYHTHFSMNANTTIFNYTIPLKQI